MAMYIEIPDVPGKPGNPNYRDHIPVHAADFSCSYPTDATSGMASGHRVPSKVRLVSPVGKHAVLLFGKMSNNERLGDVTLKFDGSPAGDRVDLEIILTGARCMYVDFGLAGAGGLGDSSFTYHLVYETMAVRETEEGAEVQMDWVAQTV